VTLVEPGGYSTDWSGASATHSEENPAYADVREAAKSRPSAASPSDPTATRGAILKVVDADKPPLRIFFGKTPIEIATKDYESRLAVPPAGFGPAQGVVGHAHQVEMLVPRRPRGPFARIHHSALLLLVVVVSPRFTVEGTLPGGAQTP
jgi:hypothetical protein